MNYTIEYLLEKIETDGKFGYDLDKIMTAYDLANSAHKGQVRSSGEPYISHPLAVACILLEFNMDSDTICAAILHDVVEDTVIELSEIKKKFGKDVALLVDGVTKIGMVPIDYTKEEQEAENTRKILMAMAEDVRVILIKLADRLHNMRTLDSRPPDKQRANAFETMNLYAPIALRLGMNSLREEMEALSLRYLDPFSYKHLEEQILARKEERDNFINTTKERILERIGLMEPPPIIEGRVKGIYGIYKKVFVDGKNFDEVYDIYAVRIIVQSVIECYNILGIIHDMYRPIPGRFKDYIALPKPNRYQSLHTTVIGKEGVPFEVQVRTQDMHNTAEFGVAAHWKYKGSIKSKLTKGDTKVEWLRSMIEQQQEADDVRQLAEAIKTDLAPDDVYVFTPRGEIITLPLGSTVIDFAYAIHSQVGNKMTGAKVGGRMVSFDYQLVTGDIINIMTTNSSNYGPNRNWLENVKTNQAKVKIRAWFRRERRPENIAEGRSMLDREIKKYNIPPNELPELLTLTARELRYSDDEDFLAAIGYGGIQLTRVLHKIKTLFDAKNAELSGENIIFDLSEINENIAKKQSGGVIVEGIDNCMVRFAKCCAPLPGDGIVGFITRGYGVSVHKSDCENVHLEENPDRWINVSWAHHGGLYYLAAIEIIAESRSAMFMDVTTVIAENKLVINEISSKRLKNGNSCIDLTIEIASAEQLNGILVKLKKIRGVIMATRKENK
jgi:GTP pyrophosphokinase